MSDDNSAAPPEVSKQRRYPNFNLASIGTMISPVALIVSLYSLYDSQRARSYVENSASLNTEYSAYKALAQLQHDNPLLSYLFSQSPEDYIYVRNIVKAGLKNVSAEEAVRLQLQERSLVNYVYTSYEETFSDWKVANNSSDKALAALLKQHLDYYLSLLCNSRLVWYRGSGVIALIGKWGLS